MVTKTPKLSDEKLAASIKAQREAVKTGSKGTIINRFNAGTPITEVQFKEISGQVDPLAVKNYTKQQVVVDKTTGQFTGYKDVKMCVNKRITRVYNAVDAGKLDDGSVASISLMESENSADLEDKMTGLHMERSKLSSLNHTFHTREVTRKIAAMEKAGYQKQTFDEIYDAAVTARNLTNTDIADVEIEQTIVVPAV